MALVVTPGASDANSYVSLEEAVAYFDAESHPLGTFWASLTNERREGVLRRAASMLNRCRWQGCPVRCDQALAFPRVGACRWEPTTIPPAIKEAQMEQAVHLARHWQSGGQSKRAKLQAEGVQSFSLGEMSESYAVSRTKLGAAATPDLQLADTARSLLVGALRTTGCVYHDR